MLAKQKPAAQPRTVRGRKKAGAGPSDPGHANIAIADTAGVNAETLRTMYRHMIRARVLDERMWLLNRQGRAPFVISGQGHEAVQAGIALTLRPGHDWIAPYYRDLCLMLALGTTPRDQLLALLARAEDPNSGGRQMPSHYGHAPLRIISTGSCVATQVLHAAGMALACKIRGDDAIAFASMGDGSTSEGDFMEGLNFAAVHRLPMVCLVENNGYAISVPWEKQMPTPDVADRAKAYGIPGVIVDGNDPVASYHVMCEAVDRARSGGGPSLIEAKVNRLTPHSSDDDEKQYRSAESLADAKAHDCVVVFQQKLMDDGVITMADAEALRAETLREIDQAQVEAENAPLPTAESALLHVYGDA